jgi:TonB family protein
VCALALLFATRAVAQAPAREAPSGTAPPNGGPDGDASSVTPPRLIHALPAVVPDGVELRDPAVVTLALTIDEAGHVSDASVVESSGAQLDQSALDAARQFEFEPARRDGTPLMAKIRYRYVFPARVAAPPEPEPTRAPEAATQAPAAAPANPAQTHATTRTEPEEFSAVATVEAPAREPTRRTVSGEMLTEVPGTRGDALRAIEVMPGVGRTSLTNGDPILRGAAQEESQTYLNGVPVPFLYHFGGLTSFFSSRYIDRVDLYPGNFSTRYGQVSGGVIDVRTRDPQRDGFHAGADLNLIDSSAFVSTSAGPKASFAIAARRSNIDLVFSNFVPKNTYSVVAAPLYYDYQALATYHMDARNTLRVIGYGARDSLQLFFSNPSEEDPALTGKIGATVGFHRLQAELENKLGDATTQNLSVTAGSLSFSQQIGGYEQVISGAELHGRGEWRTELLPELSVTTGIDFSAQFLSGRYAGPAPGAGEGDPSGMDSSLTRRTVSLVVPSLNVVRPGAYLEFGLRPEKHLLIVPGLRADYYGDLGRSSFDPRLTARYEVTADFALKSGVGYYTQAPQYWQALSAIGNPQIEPYRALQTSFGFEEHAGNRLKFGAEGFYKRLTNRIIATPGSVAPHFINDGEGRIYGVEISAEYHPQGGSFFYLAYTLSRSERRDGDEPYRLFDHDEPHVLALTASQVLGRGWTAGARFRLISGDPSTAVVGSTYDAHTGIYVPTYGPVNGQRDPAFQELDLRLEKAWHVGAGRIAAYVDVLNVYNAKNPQGYRYSFDYTKKEAVSGLGLFPNLGLKGEL